MANVTKELVLNETFMSTEQTPRNVADILADELENIANVIEGGGSGGHTIQNDSGTALPQESALQFVGVYSEDDSTNGKTKVNIIREMTKAQMDALSTDAKKGVIHTTDEADNPANPISADDVTYGSGTVADALDKAGKFTKLWENPNPSVSFAAQTVTLASDDYDLLMVVCQLGMAASHQTSQIIVKGGQGVLTIAYSTGSSVLNLTRLITANSGATLTFDDAYAVTASASDVNNSFIIPVAIYGIKL